MTTSDLAEFLRLTRLAASLTRREVAERSPVTEETLRRWEAGESLGNVADFLSTLEHLGVRIVVTKRKRKSTNLWMRLEVP